MLFSTENLRKDAGLKHAGTNNHGDRRIRLVRDQIKGQHMQTHMHNLLVQLAPGGKVVLLGERLNV